MQPPTKDILQARMPVAAAAAVEAELGRLGNAAGGRQAPSLGLKSSGSSEAVEAALEEVASAFKSRDAVAFKEAIRQFTSLDETGGDGAMGARLTGSGLAKVLGPLISADRASAKEFLKAALPQEAQQAGAALTASAKARLAEKAVKEQKREYQEEMLKSHLQRRAQGLTKGVEDYGGPDAKCYTVICMPSAHDGWEKQGVRTEFPFPGYGFGAHQAVIQYDDLGIMAHQGEVDAFRRGETFKKWAEAFVADSVDTD
jgi:hypothetical protein